MNYKQPVSALVVIHSPEMEFLLIERARHPGFWQSVTGSREGGESLLETAYREVEEETGIRAEPGSIVDHHRQQVFEIYPLWRQRYAPGITRNTEHLFSLCVPRDTAIRLAPTEHRALRWARAQEAAAACFSPSNREAILALGRGKLERA
jgi:dATP pyrophosphohydrolase